MRRFYRLSRSIVPLFLAVVFVLGSSGRSNADFAQDYQNYLKTYEAYRGAHNEYLSARNRYLQFDTLVSKNEALDSVKKFLLARADTLLGHISLIRVRGYDASFTTLLAQEESFLNDHKAKVTAVSSLEDAVSVSKDVERRHVALQIMSRKITGLLLLAKVEDFNNRFMELENEASGLIAQLKEQGFDVSVPERWLLDAKQKKFLAQDKIEESKLLISSMRGKTVNDVAREYNAVQFSIFEANQYIREGMDFFGELTNSIKYGKF